MWIISMQLTATTVPVPTSRQVFTQIDITYESSVGFLIEWYMYATWLLFGVE